MGNQAYWVYKKSLYGIAKRRKRGFEEKEDTVMKYVIIKGCNSCHAKRFQENYLYWYCGDLEDNHSMATNIQKEVLGKTIHKHCQLANYKEKSGDLTK